MKKLIVIGLFVIFIFALFSLRFLLTDNFSAKNIVLTPMFTSSEKLSSEKKEEVMKILSQPYYYFAKGHHALAFISEDSKYILKFLRAKKLQRPLIFSFANTKGKQREHLHGKRLSFILNSHALAHNPLKEETAVIYSHFFKTEDFKQNIHLYDKLKREFLLDADTNSFILQKKVDLYEEVLPKTIQKKDISAVKQMISSYFQVIASRCKKGIMNKDRGGWGRNYGIIEGVERAYEIDIGSYIVSEKVMTKEGMEKEIRECSRDFRRYVKATLPQMLDFFDENIKETVEANYQPLR